MPLPKLGDRARDTITGLTGTVTGDYRQTGGRRTFWLEGTHKDGKPWADWVDKSRIAIDIPGENLGQGGSDLDGEG